MPPIAIRPPAIRVPGRAWPSRASADRRLAGARLADEADDLAAADRQRDVVDDLLAPVRVSSTRSPRTSTTLIASPPSVRGDRPRDALGDEVRPDREDGDAERGDEHRPGLHRDRDAVLVDHQAPVGVRWLDAEAEEADGGDERDRPGQPEAVLDASAASSRSGGSRAAARAAAGGRSLGRLDVLAVRDLER